MKYVLTLLLLVNMLFSHAQEKVNPVIKNFGGIYDIPEATVKPDPNQEYKIVIDVYGGSDDSEEIDRSLNKRSPYAQFTCRRRGGFGKHESGAGYPCRVYLFYYEQ